MTGDDEGSSDEISPDKPNPFKGVPVRTVFHAISAFMSAFRSIGDSIGPDKKDDD